MATLQEASVSEADILVLGGAVSPGGTDLWGRRRDTDGLSYSSALPGKGNRLKWPKFSRDGLLKTHSEEIG